MGCGYTTEAEKQRAVEEAETIAVAINGPDGKVDVNARLNGTIKELTEQVAARFGLNKTCPLARAACTCTLHMDVTLHFCGYQLQPVTKTVREFTELCEGSEIDPQGIEMAKKAVLKHAKEATAFEVLKETDWSGVCDFDLRATICTTTPGGTIVGKAFRHSKGSEPLYGLWKKGCGRTGQAKMLFLRDGHVCFDIGWVGCVTGATTVADGETHQVGVSCRNGIYTVHVDGKTDGTGCDLATPDHIETGIVVGTAIGHSHGAKRSDMAPDFQGTIEDVSFDVC